MVNVRNIIEVLITFTYYAIADTFSFLDNRITMYFIKIYGKNLPLPVKKLIPTKLEQKKLLNFYFKKSNKNFIAFCYHNWASLTRNKISLQICT